MAATIRPLIDAFRPALSRPASTLLMAAGLAIVTAGTAWSQAIVQAPIRIAQDGPSWNNLTAAQRQALHPLQDDWSEIDADHKQKWLEVGARFPSMTEDERRRVQVRMAEWARLSPIERGRARLNFQQAKQVPAEDRQARWESYQSLSPDQKRELAARAAASVPSRKAASVVAKRPELNLGGAPRPKSNIVPNPAFAAPPRPVAPTVVRAQPGATTSLISKAPAPPAHQQTGLPKIATTPQLVDRATLLPQRGPQAAGVQSAPAASPVLPRR